MPNLSRTSKPFRQNKTKKTKGFRPKKNKLSKNFYCNYKDEYLEELNDEYEFYSYKNYQSNYSIFNVKYLLNQQK